MKQTWFTHDPMTTNEATQLILRYQSRNIETHKTLSADPRLWIVSALLPEFSNEPVPSRTWQQSIWS